MDFNKPRMRWVAQAILTLSASPGGFTASELADRVRTLSRQSEAEYGPRRAAYELKKLRGKQIVRRINQTRKYETIPAGLKALTAIVVLRNKAFKPLLAAAQQLQPTRGAQDPTTLDNHYEILRLTMQGIFRELGVAA